MVRRPRYNFLGTRYLRCGMAYILSLFMLALLTSLAVAVSSGTSMNLARAENMQKAFTAQLAAEDGMQFMLQTISAIKLDRDTTYETLMTNLGTEIGELMNDTPNLGDAVISGTESSVTVPAIMIEGSAFSCVLTRLSPNASDEQQCRLTVLGSSGGTSRSISVDLYLKLAQPPAFAYGIASKGTIEISGNAEFLSMSDSPVASIFSAADDATVVTAKGHAKLAGDIYACAPDVAAVALTGNVKVAGETDTNVILNDHTHLGQPDPEFPDIDLTPFDGLTTTVIDASTPTAGTTVENALIVANADPTFSGNTTINGILYIEAPNNVKFTGNLVINGFIVTADGNSLPLPGNQLTFTGNVSVPGVDAAPDTAEFAAVKALSGTAILAPGFGVTFTGNNDGINGMIAANQLTFKGNTDLGGELTGMVVGLADLPMKMQGNTTISINRQDEDYLPIGFKYHTVFKVVSGTYAESTP
jgi:hypothetical protein